MLRLHYKYLFINIKQHLSLHLLILVQANNHIQNMGLSEDKNSLCLAAERVKHSKPN